MILIKRIFAVSVLATLITTNLNAAGFAVSVNSASGVGNANAGVAAIAEDASTIFYNPAGLSKLEGKQVVIAGHFVSATAEFTNNGSTTNAVFPTGGGAISGGDEDGAGSAFVPNFYYANQLNDKWTFGLGINAPFGSSTEYSDTWVGRYQATESEIKTININPSVSFKANEKLSVGFGVNVQYIEASLANQLDSAAICLAAGGGAACLDNTFSMTAVGDVTTDSSQSLSGDDWSFGWNFGLLYDINDDTRLGFAYRSSVEHTVTGTADFTRSAELNAFLGAVGSNAFTDTAASVGVDMPETLSLSVYHTVSPKWAMMADVTWTKWVSFDELVVNFDNVEQPSATIPEHWENSLRYSVGANYQADAKWLYRVGVALDESPISSAEDRTARIPGNDRIWLSFGFGYKTSDSMSIDVGYSHVFIKDGPINNTDAFGHTLTGNYEASADILSAQVNWKF